MALAPLTTPTAATAPRAVRLAAAGSPGGGGLFNGATVVEIIAAPAAHTVRTCLVICLANLDSGSHTFKLWHKIGSTSRLIFAKAIAAGVVDYFEKPVKMSGITMSITGAIEGAHADAAPTFSPHWKDEL